MSRLGPDAVVARSVNGKPGLWVGFSIDRDRYWLQADTAQAGPLTSSTWFVWIGIALLATLLGSVVIARLINRPLRELSFAASRIREGDLDSRLDENTLTSEIREVNRGFNRMARELAKVEEDRAVMLAGIRHDLRTPLARLRLETEMSVSDEEAKRNMALDIEQLDAIIDKFMDYARPGETEMRPVHLSQLIDREAGRLPRPEADPHQLARGHRPDGDGRRHRTRPRLLQPVRERPALRPRHRHRRGRGHGRAMRAPSPGSSSRCATRARAWRPHDSGQLTTPFFRGDAARTAATGAGLGLAIVEKSMQRMGGTLELANAPDGGLVAQLRLKQA